MSQMTADRYYEIQDMLGKLERGVEIGHKKSRAKFFELIKEKTDSLYSIMTITEIVNRNYNNHVKSIEFDVANGKLHNDIVRLSLEDITGYPTFDCENINYWKTI